MQLILKYMVEVAKAFGANRKNAVADLSDALKFELHLAAKTKTDAELRDDLTSLNNVMTIPELQKNYPYVNWYDFFRRTISGVELAHNEKVMVLNTEYYTYLNGLLKRTPKRVLANYIVWNVLQNLLPFLPKRVRDLELGEKEEDEKDDPRWKVCTQKTIEL